MADQLPTFRAIARLLRRLLPSWRAVRRASLAIILVTGAGYLSNALTSARCVDASSLWVRGFFASAHVHEKLNWLQPNELADYYPTHPHALEGTGIPTEGLLGLYWKTRFALQPLYLPRQCCHKPWAFTRPARPYLPFVVRVAYGCLAKDLYGQAGVHTYLTLFGAHVRIHDRPLWYS